MCQMSPAKVLVESIVIYADAFHLLGMSPFPAKYSLTLSLMYYVIQDAT